MRRIYAKKNRFESGLPYFFRCHLFNVILYKNAEEPDKHNVRWLSPQAFRTLWDVRTPDLGRATTQLKPPTKSVKAISKNEDHKSAEKKLWQNQFVKI